jgi:hypothetical protein
MRSITSLCILLFFLIGMYSCTPESSEYPKKYVYTTYSIKSAEMYSKEGDTSFEIVNGREEFITGIVDTVKLWLDSLVIDDVERVTSYTLVDEEFIRIKGNIEPGLEFDTILPYYIQNSFIYVKLYEDSTNFVIGYKASEELIEKYFITTIIKRSVNNPIGFHGAPVFDFLDDLTVNEFLLKLNEGGRIAIGDSVIAIVHPYNYVLE